MPGSYGSMWGIVRARRSFLVSIAAMGIALTLTSPALAQPASHDVLELRQYKTLPGRRDELINLWEGEFVESQEALGMGLPGQFRDVDDPSRFTWLRTFATMNDRDRALSRFYYGEHWAQFRQQANATIFDNDNVLLLRPAAAGRGLILNSAPRPPVGSAPASSLVIVTIHYLWRPPSQDFVAFFRDNYRPALERAGYQVLGEYIPESEPNNFPRLPVRQHENVFVWIARFDDAQSFAQSERRLRHDPAWSAIDTQLRDLEERTKQELHLAPTSRSLLR